MKICPKHGVEIHVYTTFEFCPECEKEKEAVKKDPYDVPPGVRPIFTQSQVEESLKKTRLADQLIGRIQRKPLQMPNKPSLNAPGYPVVKAPKIVKSVSRWMASGRNTDDYAHLYAVINQEWKGQACQWSHLFKEYVAAEDALFVTPDKGAFQLVEIYTLPQPIDWHHLYKSSRQQWTIWQPGTSVLKPGDRKAEVVKILATILI